jgi:hypothetical protein
VALALLHNEAKKNVGSEPLVRPLSARIGAVPAPAVEDLLAPPSEAALASSRARTYFDPSSAVSGNAAPPDCVRMLFYPGP